MNDTHFNGIADDKIKEIADERRLQRAERRVAALNAVSLARTHANRDTETYTQNEADVIVAIMELLDRVASP